MARVMLSELESLVGASGMSFIQPLLDDAPATDVEWTRGPQHVAALHRVAGAPLIVIGDLRVDGPVLLEEHAWLVVTGDVSARDVWATAAIYVHGSVRVDGLLYLNSLNDYSVSVAGSVDVALLVEEGMRTTICGSFSGAVLSSQNIVRTGADRKVWPRVDAERFEEAIAPRAFEPDEHGNGGLREGLFELLRRGDRPLPTRRTVR